MINKDKLTEICNTYGVQVIDETISKSKLPLPNLTAREQANNIHWEWKLAMEEF